MEKTGLFAGDMILKHGEDYFREQESAVLAELGKQSGLIIATGGGCITRERNYPLLHQNGQIFWLKRDLAKLPTDGRPLSQQNPLDELYEKRKALYERFADTVIDNNSSAIEQAVEHILEATQ